MLFCLSLLLLLVLALPVLLLGGLELLLASIHESCEAGLVCKELLVGTSLLDVALVKEENAIALRHKLELVCH